MTTEHSRKATKETLKEEDPSSKIPPKLEKIIN